MKTRRTNAIVVGTIVLVAMKSILTMGASLQPDDAVHHGFECTTVPCPSVTHEAHEFGTAISSSIDSDRFVVGAPFEDAFVSNRNNTVDAGAVFLYDKNGNILNTIANPDPVTGDQFGSVVASNNDRVLLVGVPLKDTFSPTETLRIDTGAAYLFDSSGSLTTTFELPSPTDGDGFGSAIAQLGTSTVLIGAAGVDTNTASVGNVYAFSMDGVLARSFSNPSPDVGDRFGSAITVLDPDLFVVSAPGNDLSNGFLEVENLGSVHIYHTDGILSRTVDGPRGEPDSDFGSSLATLHQNLFAVGAPGNEAVFLFDAVGNFVSAITNPFPGEVSGFGGSIASVSSNRLLIGATLDDESGPHSGKVFLYNTQGNRLLDIEDPSDENQSRFGWGLASMGENNFIIGDPGSDMWETNAGSIYLYREISMTSQTQFGVEFDVDVGMDATCSRVEHCIRPSLANIEVFGTVRWTASDDGFVHRLVSGTPAAGPTGCFDTGIISPAQSYTGFFDDRIVGDIPYYCTIHTQETGVINIVRNNEPQDAIPMTLNVWKPLRVDTTNDVEWLKFFAISNRNHFIEIVQEGAEVDAILDVYVQLSDGSLSNIVANLNESGPGIGLGEITSGVRNGMYFVRVSYADIGRIHPLGEGTESKIRYTIASLGNDAYIFALDRVTMKPPEGSELWWNGISRGTINSETFEFSNPFFPSGPQTFEVTTNPGILPVESPLLPGQVNELSNLDYGNPRILCKFSCPNNYSFNRITVFQFFSSFRVTGQIVDQWTGEFIQGAKIVFLATSGNEQGTDYTRYPHEWYGTQWTSQGDGSFPANVILPTARYDLTLTKIGYHPTIDVSTVQVSTPQAVDSPVDLDILFMTPIDTNDNNIADQWEQDYGILELGIDPADDLDKDGISNRDEYLAGTDPNDSTSKFVVVDTAMTSDGFKLLWGPLVQGRNYTVQQADSTSGVRSWTTVAGPSSSSFFPNGWTDTNSLNSTKSVYRIMLTVP